MKSKKWKSIAVTVDIYDILKRIADENERSVSRQLAHMLKAIDQEK